MKDLKSSLKVYAVTDRYWLNGRKLKDDVRKAILGGATMIQLREKELDFESFVKEAKEIKEVCKEYDIPFIINDSIEVFLACDADGIHVGQEDMVASEVRKIIGNNKILGVSATNLDEAIKAYNMGADYLGVGTIFNTSTKLDAKDVSFDTLVSITNTIPIPVVAIGGITKDNIKELKNTGIDGVAVVSAIFGKEDIIEETKLLDKEISNIVFDPSKYNSFIVDYDGTILDSLDMWEDIASRYVESKGFELEEDLDLIVKKMSNKDGVIYIKNHYLKEKSIEEIEKDLDSFVAKEYLSLKIDKSIINFLKDLKRYGKLYLFTATSYSLVTKSLMNNNIYQLFDEIYTSSNFNFSKETGEGYKKIVDLNNLNKEKTLVIEDAIHAIIGANKCNLDVLAIKTKDNNYKDINNYTKYYINLRKRK